MSYNPQKVQELLSFSLSVISNSELCPYVADAFYYGRYRDASEDECGLLEFAVILDEEVKDSLPYYQRIIRQASSEASFFEKHPEISIRPVFAIGSILKSNPDSELARKISERGISVWSRRKDVISENAKGAMLYSVDVIEKSPLAPFVIDAVYQGEYTPPSEKELETVSFHVILDDSLRDDPLYHRYIRLTLSEASFSEEYFDVLIRPRFVFEGSLGNASGNQLNTSEVSLWP